MLYEQPRTRHTASPAGAIRQGFAALIAGWWQIAQAGIATYGLAEIGYLLARLSAGERWRWIAFANNLIPWMAFLSLGLGGIALVSRRRWLLIALQLPMVIAFLAGYGDRFWPRHPAALAEHQLHIRVATFNVAAHSDPARIADAIADLDADIVGLQELDQSHAAALNQWLVDAYPYRLMYAPSEGDRHGVGLLSRYPILVEDRFYPCRRCFRSLRVVVDADGSPVAVYLIHPSAPRNSWSPWAYNAVERARQLSYLRRALRIEPYPALVLCDCNMSDQSDDYRALDSLMDDSFREAGRGLGFTFPAGSNYPIPVPFPVVRIDYIWHSAHFVPLDAAVAGDSGTSDHYPVVATLALMEERATE